MQFIAYLLNTQNMAKLAAGDWLIPANPASGKLILKSTKRTGSWSGRHVLRGALPQGQLGVAEPYPRWKAEVAQSNFVQYLAGRSRCQELGKNLSDGWTRVRGK